MPFFKGHTKKYLEDNQSQIKGSNEESINEGNSSLIQYFPLNIFFNRK